MLEVMITGRRVSRSLQVQAAHRLLKAGSSMLPPIDGNSSGMSDSSFRRSGLGRNAIPRIM